MRKQFNKDTGCGRPNGRLLHFLYISGGTYCSMGGILNGERKSDAREQRSEIDSVCFSFRIVKIWIYSLLLPISRSLTVTVRRWPAYS